MTNAHRGEVIRLAPTRPAVFSTRYLRGSWLTRASALPPWVALALRVRGLQSRQHRQPDELVRRGRTDKAQE